MMNVEFVIGIVLNVSLKLETVLNVLKTEFKNQLVSALKELMKSKENNTVQVVKHNVPDVLKDQTIVLLVLTDMLIHQNAQ